MCIYVPTYISDVDTTSRFDRWPRASRHIRDGTRTNRLAFCDLCDHREPSPTVCIKTRRMLYARARNAYLVLMHGRCHTVQFHAPFHAWSPLAKEFSADIGIDSIARRVDLEFDIFKRHQNFFYLNNIDILISP